MNTIIELINKKTRGIIWTLMINGVILVILSLLIARYDFMARITIALVVLVLAYTCLYLAYKIWHLKNEITKTLKIK